LAAETQDIKADTFILDILRNTKLVFHTLPKTFVLILDCVAWILINTKFAKNLSERIKIQVHYFVSDRHSPSPFKIFSPHFRGHTGKIAAEVRKTTEFFHHSRGNVNMSPCCSLPRHHSTPSGEILRQRGRKHHRELDQV
jgi:hypothetical protein